VGQKKKDSHMHLSFSKFFVQAQLTKIEFVIPKKQQSDNSVCEVENKVYSKMATNTTSYIKLQGKITVTLKFKTWR